MADDPNNPDVALSVGFDFNTFRSALSLLKKEMESAQNKINNANENVSKYRSKLNSAVDKEEQAQYERQIKLNEQKIAYNQKMYDTLEKQYNAYIERIKQIGETADLTITASGRGGTSIKSLYDRQEQDKIKQQSEDEANLLKQRQAAEDEYWDKEFALIEEASNLDARRYTQGELEREALLDRYYQEDSEKSAEEFARYQELQKKKAVNDRQLTNKRKADDKEISRAQRQQVQENAEFQKNIQRGLIAFGFSLLGSGLPGTRLASAVSIGAGFGGPAGAIGAAAGAGLVEVINLVRELTSAYVDFAKEASDVIVGQDQLREQTASITEAYQTGLNPALVAVQETEIRFLQALNDNKDVVREVAEDIGDLVRTVTALGELFILTATNSKTLEEALWKLGSAAHFLANPYNLIGLAGGVGATIATGPLLGGYISDLLFKGIPQTPRPPAGSPLQAPLPAGLNIPNIPPKNANETIFQREDELQGVKNKLIEQEAELRKKLITATDLQAKTEIANAQTEIASRKKLIDDEIKNYSDLNNLEKQRQKVLKEGRDNELAQLRIRNLEAEYNLTKQILDSDLQRIQLEGQIREQLANLPTGLEGARQAVPLTQRETELDLAKVINDETQKILAAKDRLAEATKEVEIQQSLVNKIPAAKNIGSPFETERRQENKRLDDLRVSQEKALHDYEILKMESVNRITQAEMDGRAKVAAATKKEQDELYARQRAIIQTIQTDLQDFIDRTNSINDRLLESVGVSPSKTVTPEDILNEGKSSIGTAPNTQAAADSQRLHNNNEILKLKTKALESDREDLEIQLKNTRDYSERLTIISQILTNKEQEQQLLQIELDNLKAQRQIIEQSVQPEADKDKAINQINADIQELEKEIESLNKASENWFDQFAQGMDAIAGNISRFSSSVGAAVRDVNGLVQNIEQLKHVKIPGTEGQEAGSIFGGLKSIFTNGLGNFLSQGLPLIGGIASAAMGIFSTIKGMFTKAAREMADAITKAVDEINKSVQYTGKIQDAIVKLEEQRNKALTDLANKKGGKDQLQKILPGIDDSIASLKERQKQIIDDFNTDLRNLDLPDYLGNIASSWDTINKKVQDYINAAGQSEDVYQKAWEYLDKSAQKMRSDIQSQIDKENKDFFQGAEDEQGNLISLEQDATNKKLDAQKQYYDTIDSLEKQKAQAIKDNNKAEQDSLKQIADLEQQLIDLNNQEKQQIKDIQNEGIAERQKTTQQDKAQRIADLLDQNKQKRQDITSQIADIKDAQAARNEAFNEQMANIAKEENQATTDYNNTIMRINNEFNRRKQEHEDLMTQLTDEYTYILTQTDLASQKVGQMHQDWIDGVLDVQDSYQQLFDMVTSELTAVAGLTGGTLNPQIAKSLAQQIQNNITVNLPPGSNLTPDDVARAVQDALNRVLYGV